MSELLYAIKNFCQSLLNDGGRNERGLADWSHIESSTPEGVPLPSYRYEGGTQGFATKKVATFSMCFALLGLLKPAGNVGQQRKG